MDIRRFMLDLLTEQVAGYYDPKAKTLYVVEGYLCLLVSLLAKVSSQIP
jgi:hypothetical protein